MNPLCKKLPGLQPEPLHHQILNTIPPASTVVWYPGLSPVSVHCNSVEPSPHCHHNHASWHAQAGYHVAQNPSWCGPLRSTRCIILLTAQALHHVISMHLPSWTSDSGQRYVCCSGLSSYLGSSLQRGPFSWCVGDTFLSAHQDDFVWLLSIT
jgi:hypothetical protein